MSNSTPPIVETYGEGRILVFDSATYVGDYLHDHPAQDDVVVAASYAGVLCAKMIMEAKPRATIGLDCAIGKDGAGISGLWFYEALGVPAAATDVMTAEMGNGKDMYEEGVISRLNDSAQRLGLTVGMSVKDAARALLTGSRKPSTFDPARRLVIETNEIGRSIVCTDSIAFALPEDRERNVLCTAGHTGRSVVEYFRSFPALGVYLLRWRDRKESVRHFRA